MMYEIYFRKPNNSIEEITTTFDIKETVKSLVSQNQIITRTKIVQRDKVPQESWLIEFIAPEGKKTHSMNTWNLYDTVHHLTSRLYIIISIQETF